MPISSDLFFVRVFVGRAFIYKKKEDITTQNITVVCLEFFMVAGVAGDRWLSIQALKLSLSCSAQRLSHVSPLSADSLWIVPQCQQDEHEPAFLVGNSASFVFFIRSNPARSQRFIRIR